MPQEMQSLMSDLPADLQDGSDGGAAAAADEDLQDDDDQGAAGAAGAGGDDEEEDDNGAGGAGTGNDEDEDDDDQEDFVEELDDDEDTPPTPPAAKTPEAPASVQQASLTDEGQYILGKLGKIQVRLLMPSADGKGEVKQFEVYGWGDLPRDMLGFATAYEQSAFTGSAMNNEMRARELQTEFRQQKITADTEAYTMRENQAIARDLRQLRKDGMFPKFKGVPGSEEFDNSDGAKVFDEVVAYMNEQNDLAGQHAQKGGAYYHISFRQAYQILHPEAFDKTKQQQARAAGRDAARKVKSGNGGQPGSKNVQTKRVSNITDLADEFNAFAGGAAK